MKTTEFIISKTLKELGVNPGLLGYEYMRCAIKLALHDESIMHSITTGIFSPQ